MASWNALHSAGHSLPSSSLLLDFPVLNAPDRVAQPPRDRDAIECALTEARPTAGYMPTLPIRSFTVGESHLPSRWLFERDIEAMICHPAVESPLSYYRSGIGGAEFEVQTVPPIAQPFVEMALRDLWEKSLPQVQIAYEYGRVGCEVVYREEDGQLRFDGLVDFSPTNVTPQVSTRTKVYSGIRVSGVPDSEQQQGVYLWGPNDDGVPSKGFWYVHRPRFNPFVGRSQLWGAWRPWARLARRDGAEEIIDGGVYRCAYQGPTVRYPPQSGAYERGPTGDSSGRVSNRDIANEYGRQAKFGTNVAMPSVKYPDGSDQWSIEWPDTKLQLDQLLNYEKRLHDLISLGIGVPPELLQASETGSGYSGRAIPLEGYFLAQQTNATAIVEAFTRQILDPLVKWNYGDEARVTVRVLPLLASRQKAAAASNPEQSQGGFMSGGGGGPSGASTHYAGAGISKLAPGPARYQQMATERAPEGGETAGGRKYAGGQFVPGEGGATEQKETPANPVDLIHDIRANFAKYSIEQIRAAVGALSKLPPEHIQALAQKMGYSTIKGSRPAMLKQILGILERQKTSQIQVSLIGLKPPQQMATADEVIDEVARINDVPGVPGAEAIARALAGNGRESLLTILRYTPTELWSARIAEFLTAHRDQFASALRAARLAALLLGARRVAITTPAGIPQTAVGSSVALDRPRDEGPPWRPSAIGTGELPDDDPFLPIIESAADDLANRAAFTRADFDRLDAQARADAFTVAGIEEQATIEKVRDAIAETVKEGANKPDFLRRVDEAIGQGTFLSDAHAETVFRTNVQTAYSHGMDDVLNNPIVGDLFPYEAVDPILDNRARTHHKRLATGGLNGTNIYRRNDPIYQQYLKPPSGFNCRCSRRPVTIEQAAEAGVKEARQWIETGEEPTGRQFNSVPDWWIVDPHWVRMGTANVS